MWYADLLGQWPDTEACFRVSVIEINLTDKLINLIGEHVRAPTPGFGAVTGETICALGGTRCRRLKKGLDIHRHCHDTPVIALRSQAAFWKLVDGSMVSKPGTDNSGCHRSDFSAVLH